MEAGDQGPSHLAQAVFRALTVSVPEPPSEALLGEFFEALYQVSFRDQVNRGEGPPQLRRVVWQGPEECADSVSGFLRLMPPVPLHPGSLASLLTAAGDQAVVVSAEPSSEGEAQALVILGIVPRGVEEGRCGLFRADILGPAHLKVEAGLDYPLELRRNRLRLSALNVFGRGPVQERLSALLQPVFPAVQAVLPPDIAASPLLSGGAFPLPGGSVLISEQEWPEIVEQFWLKAFALLLERVFEARTSGLVAVSPRPDADGQAEWDEDWTPQPHKAAYPQVRHLLEERAAEAIRQQVHAVGSLPERLASQSVSLDDLALQEPASRLRPPGSDPEIASALQMLASLTRAEGILRLDPHLDLVSFGGQPGASRMPERVYLAGDELASELTPISLRSFGPRNQALLRLCYQDPQALGFAFTQEGEIRAMLRQEEKLIVWNTILLPR